MAYVTPPTFVADDVLAADDLNILGDDIVYLKGITDGVSWSATHLQRAANQSMSDSTITSMSFDTELLDAGGWWSSGTDVTVPAGAVPAGYTTIACHVIGAIRWAANGTGVRRVYIYVDGSEVDHLTFSGLAGENTTVVFPTYITVDAGAVITLRGYQDSGGSLNFTGNLWVVRHAPVS